MNETHSALKCEITCLWALTTGGAVQTVHVHPRGTRLAVALAFTLPGGGGHVQEHLHALHLSQLAAQLLEVAQLLSARDPRGQLGSMARFPHPGRLGLDQRGGIGLCEWGGGGGGRGSGHLVGSILVVQQFQRPRLEGHIYAFSRHAVI